MSENAAENRKAQAIPHALTREEIYDSAGRLVGRREHHYRTCRRCKLERAGVAREGHNESHSETQH